MEDKRLENAEKLGVQGGVVVGTLYFVIVVAICGLLQLPYIVPVVFLFLIFVLFLINFKNEATKQGKLD